MSPRASLVMFITVGAGEQDSSQLGLHLGIGQIRSPFFCHDDNVPGRQKLLVTAEKLPQETFHPVALAGLPHLAARHQPQPGACGLARGQGYAEVRRVPPFSPGLGPEVFPAAANPLVPGKAGPLRGCITGGLGGVLQGGSLFLHREAFAALGPAVL